MPFNPRKNKNWKGKLADLKAILSGKETLESLDKKEKDKTIPLWFVEDESQILPGINFIKDEGCEPLGTDPELVMAPRLAEAKAAAEAKDKAIMELSEDFEKPELTEIEKKERWFRKYSNKYQDKEPVKDQNKEPESEATWLRAEPGQFEILSQIERHFKIG